MNRGMKGRIGPLALMALAGLAAVVNAYADPPSRNGREGGEARGRAQARAPERYGPAPGGYAPSRGPVYAAPPPYAAAPYGRTYQAPPQAYAAPPAQAYAPPTVRGRAYVAPTQPYAPPVPYYPGARTNSLGAQWAQQQDEARNLRSQRRIIPLSSVVQTLGRLSPGHMLDAGLEPGPDGRQTYRVRWAAMGGRRIDFIIDAETGAIIGRGE